MKKRFLCLLLALALLCAILPASALPARAAATSGTCGDHLTWSFDSSTGTLTIQGTGMMGNFLSGPAPWYGLKDSIQKITIGNSVTSIGAYAFRNCRSLTSVTIPDSVTSIGGYAFGYCTSLASAVMGNSVTSIGDAAFQYCVALTSVTIPGSVTSIGIFAFENCHSLTSVTIGNNVESIGSGAFEYCSSLTDVTIPDSVTSIGGAAFESCRSLTSVTIPDSVTKINNAVFQNCTSLTSVTIGSGVKSISPYTFYHCSSLTSVTVPDNVSAIKDYAFCGCTALTSVTIGNGVKNIYKYAFCDCTSLTSLTIGSNVTYIRYGVFKGCTALTSVKIPPNVHYIGDEAFANCNPDLVIYAIAGSAAETYAAENHIAFQALPDVPVVKLTNVAASGKIKISWTAVDGAAKYRVYRASSRTGSYTCVKTTADASVLSCINTSANPGETWYYKVCAIDSAGKEGDFSEIKSRTCVLPRPVVKGSHVAKTGKNKLTWNAVDGAKEYRVYRSASKTETYNLIKTTTSLSFINTSAAAGTTWYYKVMAIHERDSANSVFSEGKVLTVDLPRPVVSISLSSGKPKLTWTAIDGAKEYQVYRSTGKTGTYELIETTANLSCTDTGAAAGETWYYKVRAIIRPMSTANSAYSLVTSITATK